MRIWVGAAIIAASWPAVANAQSLSGAYVHQGDNGPVELVLEQDAANRVSGSLHGADGTVLRLEGVVEDARATGSVSVDGGTAWFAAGVVEGRLLLVVAELDRNTGQPNLESGWTMHFDRVAGGAAAAGASPDDAVANALGALGLSAIGRGANAAADGATDAAAGGAGGVNAADAAASTSPRGAGSSQHTPGSTPAANASPIVRQWIQHLSGKRLTYMDSYSSSDIGGYGGYSDRWDAYLCSDGTFYFKDSSSVTADVGGVVGYSAGGGQATGRWQIVEQMGRAIIQYRMSDGTANYGVLTFQNGETYFDGNRVYVTGENPYCR